MQRPDCQKTGRTKGVRRVSTTEILGEPWRKFRHVGNTGRLSRLGEANVQLTFHEHRTAKINGEGCIVVEPDIDYYKDLGAHALFEVIPNAVTHSLTDPREVYVLRWIAGRHAGVPEFNPPYWLV